MCTVVYFMNQAPSLKFAELYNHKILLGSWDSQTRVKANLSQFLNKKENLYITKHKKSHFNPLIYLHPL